VLRASVIDLLIALLHLIVRLLPLNRMCRIRESQQQQQHQSGGTLALSSTDGRLSRSSESIAASSGSSIPQNKIQIVCFSITTQQCHEGCSERVTVVC